MPGRKDTCSKTPRATNFVPALRAVAAGQNWIPQEVASQLASRKSLEELTSREVEVLNQLAKGLANKEIADALNITEHTVKDHLKSILAKLRVADRTEAVTTAIQRGIIHLVKPLADLSGYLCILKAALSPLERGMSRIPEGLYTVPVQVSSDVLFGLVEA